jgi:hypothetical protein
MVFGKKKRDPTAPSSKQPDVKSTDKKKDFVNSQHSSNSGSAGGVGGTGGLDDEFLLSNLSPTSYARQFEALDHVVAAASSTMVNKNRSGSLPQSSATGGRGGRGQNFSNGNKTVIRGVHGHESSLVKEIEGLKLKKTNSQNSNKNVLDFDNDSDGVFEDDDGSGTRTPSEIAAELTGGSRSNWKAGWKKKTKGKNLKSPIGVRGSSLGENPHRSGTRGDFGSDCSAGSSDDASAKSRRSNSSSVRKNSRSSSSSSSDGSGGGGRGRGHGAATPSSSSSSSMGDAYENVSLDTTESEDKDVMTSGNRATAGMSVGGEINKKSSKNGKREGEGLSSSTTAKKLGTGNGSDSAEDYTDDEDEGEDGYKQGGYHRVKIGEVYNQR